MQSLEQRMRRKLCQLKKVKNLSNDERWLFARSLAATPDERWRLHESFLRSLNLYTRSSRKAYGYK